MTITWHCEICGRKREDTFISVHKIDISERHGYPPKTIVRNIKYCNDDAYCVMAAQAGRVEDLHLKGKEDNENSDL